MGYIKEVLIVSMTVINSKTDIRIIINIGYFLNLFSRKKICLYIIVYIIKFTLPALSLYIYIYDDDDEKTHH